MNSLSIPPDNFSQIYSIFLGILSGKETNIIGYYNNETLNLCKNILKYFSIDIDTNDKKVLVVKSYDLKNKECLDINPFGIIDCKSNSLLLNMFLALSLLYENYTVIDFNTKNFAITKIIESLKNANINIFPSAKNNFPLIVKGVISINNCILDCEENSLFLAFFITILPLLENNSIVELKNVSYLTPIKRIIEFFKYEKIKVNHKDFSYFAVKGLQSYNIQSIALSTDEMCFSFFTTLMLSRQKYIPISGIVKNISFLDSLNEFGVSYKVENQTFILSEQSIKYNDEIKKIDLSYNNDYFVLILLLAIKYRMKVDINIITSDLSINPTIANLKYIKLLNDTFSALKIKVMDNSYFFDGQNFNIFNNYEFDCHNDILITMFYFGLSLIYEDRNIKLKRCKNLSVYFNNYENNIKEILS